MFIFNINLNQPNLIKMKKLSFLICVATFLASCNGVKDTESATNADSTSRDSAPADLPYTASYTSSWSDEVSDADLKMVLTTYKDWSAGNMKGLESAMGDTVEYDMNSGKSSKLTNTELLKMWTTSRDSLKSVEIDMQAWNKMYSTDKKDSYVVTWYKEIDTYKDGRVDSASYHDINQIKNGKIVWYSQFKRPLKP